MNVSISEILLSTVDIGYVPHDNTEIFGRTSIWSGLDFPYLLLEQKWSTSVIPFGKNTLVFWQPQRRKNNSSYLNLCTYMSGYVLLEWQLLQQCLFNNWNHSTQALENLTFHHSPALTLVSGTSLVLCGVKVTCILPVYSHCCKSQCG